MNELETRITSHEVECIRRHEAILHRLETLETGHATARRVLYILAGGTLGLQSGDLHGLLTALL